MVSHIEVSRDAVPSPPCTVHGDADVGAIVLYGRILRRGEVLPLGHLCAPSRLARRLQPGPRASGGAEKDFGIFLRKEIHARELVAGRGRIAPTDLIGKWQRSRIFLDLLRLVARLPHVYVINVCLNVGDYDDVELVTWDRLLNRIERTMLEHERRELPARQACYGCRPSCATRCGLRFLDRGSTPTAARHGLRRRRPREGNHPNHAQDGGLQPDPFSARRMGFRQVHEEHPAPAHH